MNMKNLSLVIAFVSSLIFLSACSEKANPAAQASAPSQQKFPVEIGDFMAQKLSGFRTST